MTEMTETTSRDVRVRLEDLLERDLHGPWDGPEEELPPGSSPAERYLLGRLVPRTPPADPLPDAAVLDSDPETVDQVLSDGTYLSRLKAPKALRRAGAADLTVRVIEYQLKDADGTITETFVLITTLLDPASAPARELAELYHARWQIETALGAFKSELKGDGVVLRSKTPEGAEQELWALLCAYHAIRELICAAAALTEQDPLRLSFVNALDTVRGPVGDPGAFPPSPHDR